MDVRLCYQAGLAPTSTAGLLDSCWLKAYAGRAVAHCAAVSPADGRLPRLLGAGLTCGREDLSSGQSCLAVDPCVAMHVLYVAVQNRRCRCHTRPASERPTAPAPGAAMPPMPLAASQAAGNVQAAATDAQRELLALRRTNMSCWHTGWAALAGAGSWAGGKGGAVGGTWLCGFPH